VGSIANTCGRQREPIGPISGRHKTMLLSFSSVFRPFRHCEIGPNAGLSVDNLVVQSEHPVDPSRRVRVSQNSPALDAGRHETN
jgi:hypothetical protein